MGFRHSGRVADVPVAPLREAFERSGLSKGELARRMGWTRANVDAVNRALGYRCDTNSRRHAQRGEGWSRRKPREHLTRDLALRLCEAIGADPVDVGL